MGVCRYLLHLGVEQEVGGVDDGQLGVAVGPGQEHGDSQGEDGGPGGGGAHVTRGEE